jgi:hypothetical protein
MYRGVGRQAAGNAGCKSGVQEEEEEEVSQFLDEHTRTCLLELGVQVPLDCLP